MNTKKYQIFISSTYEDLIEARRKVQETILSMYHFPIGMEMFSAGDDEQWEIIKETIDSSDYYVVIIGHKYGSVTFEGISYTEKEYDYAKSKGIPILAFIRERNVALTPKEMEKEADKQKKLELFIEKSKEDKMCEWWTNIDELAKNVSVALYKQFHRRNRPGWIRADNIDLSKTSGELINLSQENRTLREDNENLKNKLMIKKPVINLRINDGEEIKLRFPKEFNGVDEKFKLLKFDEVPKELRRYITEDEINNFNKALSSQEKIDAYIKKKIEYLRMKNSGCEIGIEILNDGILKANDIIIDIVFPKEIKIMEKDGIEDLKEPEELDMPVNPIKKARKEYNKRFQSVTSILSNAINYEDFGINNLRYVDLTSAYRNRNSWLDNNSIEIKLGKLMHTKRIVLDEKYLMIPFEVGRFEIKVKIICEEYEERAEFFIPILVEAI